MGVWGGLAQNSPTGLFGHTRGRDLAVAAVRVGWTVSRSDRVAADYVVDVFPAAWLSAPRTPPPHLGGPCPSDPCNVRAAFAGQRAVRGVGAAPLGIELRLRPAGRVQPFLAASGGALWFLEPVPAAGGARFNFTADLGAGVLLAGSGPLEAMAGYKLHHLSNGGRAIVNPGVDGHMLYVGLMRRR